MNLSELLFTEAAVSVERATEEGLGLLVTDHRYILFRPDRLNHSNRADNYIVGMIEVKQSSRGTIAGDEVVASAAVKGYGPLLYEIAMSNRWLISDRASVSPKAKAVWRKFFERDDVEKKYIGTSEHDYDERGDNVRERNPLNYFYRLKNPVNYSAIKSVGDNLHDDQQEKLEESAYDFFMSRLYPEE